MDIESEFWKLVDMANEIDAWSSRTLDDDALDVDTNRVIEPTYLAICKLVEKNPSEREAFALCFSELVQQKRQSPWMLVPFCMRVLRMPEVKEALHREMDQRRYGTASYARLMNYCSSVMRAYNDEIWENAIAFDHFSHELDSDISAAE